MIVTAFTRHTLAIRREARSLTKAGYRRAETDWEIHRGGRYRDVIVDVKLSLDRKHVWTKIGPKAENLKGEHQWTV